MFELKKNKESTIIVKMEGGIGNWLFQYSLARSIQVKNNCLIKLDLHAINNWQKLSNNYNIVSFNAAQIYEIPFWYRHEHQKITSKYIYYLYIKFFKTLDFFLYQPKIIREQFHHFDNKILSLTGNNYVDGYWQSYKYFESISQLLKEELKLKIDLNKKQFIIDELIRNTNSVSIHIRRGDYLTTPGYVNLSMNFFLRAIEILNKKATNLSYFIFSDDVDYVKSEFANLKITHFIEGNPNYIDLHLMSICKHNIISNSTFSWWGAYLGTFREKVVIAPEIWFNGEKSHMSSVDIMPENWIKI